MLEQLKKVCVLNMYVQSSSAHVYDIINNLLTIPNIIVGGVMSVSIFSTNCGPTRVASGILAIVSTILSSLTKQIGAGERAQQHCFVVKEYHSLIRNIDVNMMLERSLEPNDRELFIREVQNEIDRLYMVQPEPSWFAIRQFEKRYRNIDTLFFPEIERYAAGVVDKASRATISKISHDVDTVTKITNLRRGAGGMSPRVILSANTVTNGGGSVTPGSAYALGNKNYNFLHEFHLSRDKSKQDRQDRQDHDLEKGGATLLKRVPPEPDRNSIGECVFTASKPPSNPNLQLGTIGSSDSGQSASGLSSSIFNPIMKKASWMIGNVTVGYGIHGLGERLSSGETNPRGSFDSPSSESKEEKSRQQDYGGMFKKTSDPIHSIKEESISPLAEVSMRALQIVIDESNAGERNEDEIAQQRTKLESKSAIISRS